jgi:hypothetical protein
VPRALLHRSSSAPCLTGKPAALLRLMGISKPPLPASLIAAYRTSCPCRDGILDERPGASPASDAVSPQPDLDFHPPSHPWPWTFNPDQRMPPSVSRDLNEQPNCVRCLPGRLGSPKRQVVSQGHDQPRWSTSRTPPCDDGMRGSCKSQRCSYGSASEVLSVEGPPLAQLCSWPEGPHGNCLAGDATCTVGSGAATYEEGYGDGCSSRVDMMMWDRDAEWGSPCGWSIAAGGDGSGSCSARAAVVRSLTPAQQLRPDAASGAVCAGSSCSAMWSESAAAAEPCALRVGLEGNLGIGVEGAQTPPALGAPDSSGHPGAQAPGGNYLLHLDENKHARLVATPPPPELQQQQQPPGQHQAIQRCCGEDEDAGGSLSSVLWPVARQVQLQARCSINAAPSPSPPCRVLHLVQPISAPGPTCGHPQPGQQDRLQHQQQQQRQQQEQQQHQEQEQQQPQAMRKSPQVSVIVEGLDMGGRLS